MGESRSFCVAMPSTQAAVNAAAMVEMRGRSWAAVASWMGASVGAAAFAAGPLGRAFAGGAGLGIAAGVLYAAGDVGTKAAVAGGGRLTFVPALLACHGLAFVALQLGFQRGSALATAGMATLWTNALPIAAGTILFGESAPSGIGASPAWRRSPASCSGRRSSRGPNRPSSHSPSRLTDCSIK